MSWTLLGGKLEDRPAEGRMGTCLGSGSGAAGKGLGQCHFPPPPPAWSSLLICEVGTFGVCEGGWESVVSVGWTRLPGWNVQAACRRRVLVLSRLPCGFAPSAQHWSHVSRAFLMRATATGTASFFTCSFLCLFVH